MCNLYSIATNQAAIVALFRVVNRYVGDLQQIPGVPRLSSSRDPQHESGDRDDADALGHGTIAALR